MSQVLVQKIDPCVHTVEQRCEGILFTPDHVAARFFVDRRTVLGWVNVGKLDCIRISRKIIRFTEAQIEEFKSRHSLVTPTKIDKRISRRLTSPSKRKEGARRSTGDSVSELRKEMCSWQ